MLPQNHATKPYAPACPFFDYTPDFCQAIKARFNDARAYGKIHIDYIKTVILAGVKQ